MKQLKDNLTKEEELNLGFQIQEMKNLKEKLETGHADLTDEENKVIQDGENALEQLVGNYYNLARKIAHDHHKKTGTRYSIEDLLQDAVSALVEAAYKYDPYKNCRLSTYAYYGITKKVSTTINYQRLVRMPENKMGEYIEISKAQKAYRDLTPEESEKYASELDYIYEESGVSKEEVDLILENMQPQVSLNADIYDGDGELMDLLVDEDSAKEVVQYGDIDDNIFNLLKKLNDYEKNLLSYEFGAFPASMPYSEFQQKYDLTDRKMKTEVRKVIRKMRRSVEQVGE